MPIYVRYLEKFFSFIAFYHTYNLFSKQKEYKNWLAGAKARSQSQQEKKEHKRLEHNEITNDANQRLWFGSDNTRSIKFSFVLN